MQIKFCNAIGLSGDIELVPENASEKTLLDLTLQGAKELHAEPLERGWKLVTKKGD